MQVDMILLIGRLDRIISEMILASKADLDEADIQTLKHHAEDMQAAGNAILDTLERRAITKNLEAATRNPEFEAAMDELQATLANIHSPKVQDRPF